ncbi:hypothetical protein [Rothia nasimurium]|uniref:VG15 protein n=1 Tax=Rothia nasimurium TaxID=85336 RepID=UPI001F229D4F|nr:hypothetical protein [Rothia nasimurium]
MLLDMFAALLGSIVQAFRQELTPALRDLDMADSEMFEESVPMLAALVRKYRRQAAELANQLMAEEAAKVGGQALIPPVEGYADQAVHEVLTQSRSVDQVSRSLERHVRTAARRQVVRAVPTPVVPSASETNPSADEFEVEEDGNFIGEEGGGFETRPASKEEARRPAVYPVGWARVLTGKDNCAFCIVLASRGPVYSSRHHASSTSSKRWDKEGRQWANSYHDNCDCLVAPVYNSEDWLGKEAFEELQKFYKEVTKGTVASGKTVKEGNESLQAVNKAIYQLKKDGKDLPLPALREHQEMASIEFEKGRRYLESIERTIEAEDLPRFDKSKLIGKDFEETSWYGNKSQGGHSPYSTTEGKTRVPPGWNYSDFEEAAKATVRDPDYFIPAKKGPTFVKIVEDSAGNNVVLKAQVHPGTSQIVHFYPVVGQFVTKYNRGTVEYAEFIEGVVHGALRVERQRNR